MRQGRVILVDKNPAALGGICRLLESEVETVLMVADKTSLHHALGSYAPDLVLADLSFPLAANAGIVREIKDHFPEIKVIVLSIHDERSVVDDVLASGAEGFILKRRAVIDLVPAIREVLGGGRYVSSDVDEAL